MVGKSFNIIISFVVGIVFGFFLGFIVYGSLKAPEKRASSSSLNLPEGHPPIGRLPEGHPPISQLPEGHPPIDAFPTPSASDQQVQQLEEKAKAAPQNVDLRIHLGNLCLDTNRLDKAAIWYNRALELEPKELNVRTNLAVTYFRLNQNDKAIAELEKVLSDKPTFPLALLYMGTIRRDINDKKGAIDAWERLIKTNPDFQGIEKVKEQVAALKAQ